MAQPVRLTAQQADELERTLTPVQEDVIRLTPEQADELERRLSAPKTSELVLGQQMPTMKDAGALGEVALTLGTGGVLLPLSGLAGLTSLPGGVDAMVDRISAVRGLGYTPRTQGGQSALASLGELVEPLDRAAKFAGRSSQDIIQGAVGGEVPGAAAGAAVETALNFLPSLFGARGVPAGFARRQAGGRAVEDLSSRLAGRGIDVRAAGPIQREQISDVARADTGGQQFRAEQMKDVQAGITAAKETERLATDRLYAEARATKAALPAGEARKMADDIRAAIKEREFGLESMPILRLRIEELGALDKLPANSAVKLNSIEAFRKRLVNTRPPRNDASQNFALDIAVRKLDAAIDDSFNRDMIKGDKSAIEKWKTARAARSGYMKRFNNDKLIRKFVNDSATPEEIKGWIFGASSVGARPQASHAVRAIKNIVGKDSPEFMALRQEALFDIMEPLLRKEPSLPEFARNYDRFVKTNPSLAKELFPDSESALRDLRVAAESVEKVSPAPTRIDIDRMSSVALVGRSIARGGAEVNVVAKIIKAIRGAHSKSRQRKIMAELMGYDITSPVLKSPIILYGSAGPTVSGTIEREEKRVGN